MATSTTNYGFSKPAYADRADIGVINDDLDAIDSTIKEVEGKADGAQTAADEAQRLAGEAQEAADSALTADSQLNAAKLTGIVPDASVPASAHDVIEAYVVGATVLAASWLSLTDGGAPLTPQRNRLYVVVSEGTYLNRTYRWNGSAYVNIDNQPTVASQAQALAGTDNATMMTPLRTKQAIDNAALTVDSELSETSANPVQNQAITTRLNGLADDLEDATTDLQAKIDAIRTAIPEWDEEAGCYTNESIVRWMNSYSDGGLEYGVKTPLYAYSSLTSGTKIDANAGLVLEASTETSVGTNTYKGRKLFMCPRVNGGVRVGGEPYVTAIEDLHDPDHPFDETANTYALTCPYYRKVTEDSRYKYKRISEAYHEGYEPCAGMFMPDGTTKRPYILRACYMDSDGTMDSKSGTVPSAWYSAAVANRVQHCANNDFSWSKNNTANGLTYLTFGDIAWQEDFMEVMLGVKAPRSKAVGCVSYSLQYTVAVAESDVKRIVLTDAQAANVEIGSSLSVGDNSQADRYYASIHSIAKSAKVVSKTPLGSGRTAINLELDATITTTATTRVTSMPWRNGTCDNVLGTFGARTTAALTNGKEPFKFQNVEWELGLYETICNMFSTSVNADGKNTHTFHIAPDVSACTGVNHGAGWTDLEQTTVGNNNQWLYIKDYASEKGANVPKEVAGTSTTGYMTAWHSGNGAGDRETLVGGYLDNGAIAGVGCVDSSLALSLANWNIGGRSSAIGHAALAA